MPRLRPRVCSLLQLQPQKIHLINYYHMFKSPNPTDVLIYLNSDVIICEMIVTELVLVDLLMVKQNLDGAAAASDV